MEQNTDRPYTTNDMKSRLLPADALFWELLNLNRRLFKAYKRNSLAGDNSRYFVRAYLATYKTAYQQGYNRIHHETELAIEVNHDMNEILDENNYRSGDTLLLWGLIYDEPYFHAAAKNVIDRHAASLE